MFIYADPNEFDLYCTDMLLPEEELGEYDDCDVYIGEAHTKEEARKLLGEYTEELGEDTIETFLTVFDYYDWEDKNEQ